MDKGVESGLRLSPGGSGEEERVDWDGKVGKKAETSRMVLSGRHSQQKKSC